MAGWFELGKSSDGQYRFLLKEDGGNTLLTSELYRAKSGARGGIESVQTNCSADERYDRKTSSNGKAYFNLKAANHQIIGTSRMFPSEKERDAGIDAVKSNGSSTTVKDVTK
jgi:hypothetical protein